MCLKVQGKCGVKMLKVWIVIEPDGFSDGKMAGEGEMVFRNGAMYEGQF